MARAVTSVDRPAAAHHAAPAATVAAAAPVGADAKAKAIAAGVGPVAAVAGDGGDTAAPDAAVAALATAADDDDEAEAAAEAARQVYAFLLDATRPRRGSTPDARRQAAALLRALLEAGALRPPTPPQDDGDSDGDDDNGVRKPVAPGTLPPLVRARLQARERGGAHVPAYRDDTVAVADADALADWSACGGLEVFEAHAHACDALLSTSALAWVVQQLLPLGLRDALNTPCTVPDGLYPAMLCVRWNPRLAHVLLDLTVARDGCAVDCNACVHPARGTLLHFALRAARCDVALCARLVARMSDATLNAVAAGAAAFPSDPDDGDDADDGHDRPYAAAVAGAAAVPDVGDGDDGDGTALGLACHFACVVASDREATAACDVACRLLRDRVHGDGSSGLNLALRRGGAVVAAHPRDVLDDRGDGRGRRYVVRAPPKTPEQLVRDAYRDGAFRRFGPGHIALRQALLHTLMGAFDAAHARVQAYRVALQAVLVAALSGAGTPHNTTGTDREDAKAGPAGPVPVPAGDATTSTAATAAAGGLPVPDVVWIVRQFVAPLPQPPAALPTPESRLVCGPLPSPAAAAPDLS